MSNSKETKELTAMGEHIRGMKDAMEICKSFGATKLELTVFKSCIESATELLTKEREALSKAYQDGYNHCASQRVA